MAVYNKLLIHVSLVIHSNRYLSKRRMVVALEEGFDLFFGVDNLAFEGVEAEQSFEAVVG